MDHISELGYESEFHNSVGHQPIALHGAMKNPDAKAADDKEWGKLRNI